MVGALLPYFGLRCRRDSVSLIPAHVLSTKAIVYVTVLVVYTRRAAMRGIIQKSAKDIWGARGRDGAGGRAWMWTRTSPAEDIYSVGLFATSPGISVRFDWFSVVLID